MSRPRLIDLFCGAGGCSVGYHRAGFDVVGVDLHPQPRYPYEFVQADALDVLADADFLAGFDAVHASPPCQAYSDMSNCRPGLAEDYPDLVGPVRELLRATGLPYVIENVDGAGLTVSDDLLGSYGVMLCGHMFGLELYRHRAFETSWPIGTPAHPRHDIPASKAGHWEPGTIISISGHVSPIDVAQQAMGIGWMTRDELAEAIPPAYTEFIGAQLIDHLAALEAPMPDLDLHTISVVLEQDHGYASIPTLERTARDDPKQPGRYRCNHLRCTVARHDPQALWLHVHGFTGQHMRHFPVQDWEGQ